MWVVDATSLYFGLVIILATYKTHMFEEDDLTVTSSILLHVGLVKFFIPIIKFDSCEGWCCLLSDDGQNKVQKMY